MTNSIFNIKTLLYNKELSYSSLNKISKAFDLAIKFQTENRKIICDKFFYTNSVKLSVKAIAWNKKNYKNFIEINSEIILENNLFKKTKIKEIRKALVFDIYKQVFEKLL